MNACVQNTTEELAYVYDFQGNYKEISYIYVRSTSVKQVKECITGSIV